MLRSFSILSLFAVLCTICAQAQNPRKAAVPTGKPNPLVWFPEKPEASSRDQLDEGPSTAGALRFELSDNRIIVTVRVNGHGPYHFVFDSAANCVISQELANDLKVVPETSTPEVEGAAPQPSVNLESIQFGLLKLSNLHTTVIAASDLPAVGTLHVDGIIGAPVLQQSVIKVDYLRHELSFIPFERFVYTGTGTVLASDMSDEPPSVFGAVNGVPGNFIVSTGTNTGLQLFPEFVQGGKAGAEYGWESGGEAPSPELAALAKNPNAARFVLGGLKIKNVPLKVTASEGAMSSSLVDGIFGGEMLRQFTVYFDSMHKQIIMEPNRNFGRAPLVGKSSPERTNIPAASK